MSERFTVENRPDEFDPEDEDRVLTNWGVLDHEKKRFAAFGPRYYGTVREWTDKLNADPSRVDDLAWDNL